MNLRAGLDLHRCYATNLDLTLRTLRMDPACVTLRV